MNRIILIGNYPLDKQESMERFAQMLKEGFERRGIQALIWRPSVFFGRFFKSSNNGLGKWFGYLDKYMLFPVYLWIRSFLGLRDVKYHICDHSNAPYLRVLPKGRTVVTCHDVLAIRGALGYKDAYCTASGFGKVLQRYILSSLHKSKKIACVSYFTLNQLQGLSKGIDFSQKNWCVIHNGFNAEFKALSQLELEKNQNKFKFDLKEPFILHLGSSLPRKNRKLLLDMVSLLGDSWNGKICFAGQQIEPDLINYAHQLGLENRVIPIEKPDHYSVLALYSSCDAFIFPSLSEGFGWPVIEAQACGAPVIASSYDPMPEVSGGAALHADPTRPEEFAEAFASLQDIKLRQEIIEKGYENIKRFEISIMINSYLTLHGFKNSVS